jgi:hypothetical protein
MDIQVRIIFISCILSILLVFACIDPSLQFYNTFWYWDWTRSSSSSPYSLKTHYLTNMYPAINIAEWRISLNVENKLGQVDCKIQTLSV